MRPRHRRWHRRRLGLVLVAGTVLLGACRTPDRSRADDDRPVASTATVGSATTAQIPATTAPPIDLRNADLVRRRYRIACPGGEVEVDAATASGVGVDGGSLAVSGFVARFADLTGDGVVEALLPASCARSGDPGSAIESVVVVAAGPVGPAQMGGPILGREPLAVGGTVALARPLPGPGELPCCTATVRWEAVTFLDGAWVAHSGGAPVTEADVAVPEGLGSLSVGAPYPELAVTSGQPIEVTDVGASEGACTRIAIPGGLPGVAGWGGDGTLQAVEIIDPAVRTAEGFGIGTYAADVAAAHQGELRVYELGGAARELVYVPALLPELVTSFRTENEVVVEIVVGRQGWAEGGGGCFRG